MRWLCLSSKVLTDDCYADLLLGDSALLLCCIESMIWSQNPTAVPTLQDLSLFMFLFPIAYVLSFDW